MPGSCFANHNRPPSGSFNDLQATTLTTPNEREQLNQRFAREGIDPGLSDVKKLPYVWQWLNDAESNCLSLRKQIEKLHRQQEIDLLEVENYVNHVWQVSSEKIKALEKERNLLQYQLNAHRQNGCLYNCSDAASNLCESFRERTGLRGFFRRAKSGNKMPPGRSEKIILGPNESRPLELSQEVNSTSSSTATCTSASSSGNNNCVNNNGRGCNCLQVVNESRATVKELEITIRELEAENASLTGKLTQLLRVCTSLRAKVNSNNNNNNKSEKGQNQSTKQGPNNTFQTTNASPDSPSPFASRVVTSTTTSTGVVELSEKMSKETLDKASQTSNSYSLSSLLTSSAVSCTEKCTLNSTDTGIFSACSSATEVQSNCTAAFSDASREKEQSTAQMPSRTSSNTLTSKKNSTETMAMAMTSAEDVIQQLRHRIKKLEKELDSKDASYADLLKKYEMRKQLHTDTVTRLREHIERENRKWQKLFQAANLRKRQALAQLEDCKGTTSNNSNNNNNNNNTSTPTTTTVMDTG